MEDYKLRDLLASHTLGEVEFVVLSFGFYYEYQHMSVGVRDERLQTKKFMRLAHTGLVVELEHLKIAQHLKSSRGPPFMTLEMTRVLLQHPCEKETFPFDMT